MLKKWNKVLKKVTSAIVATAMLSGGIPIHIVSADQEGVLTYTLSGTEVTITACDMSASSVQVGRTISSFTDMGYKVVKIDDEAFYNCADVGSVSLPSTVVSVGDRSFYGCSSLESIYIPSSVTMIGIEAFVGCHPNLVIEGAVGSYAQSYADNNGIKFFSLSTTVTIPPLMGTIRPPTITLTPARGPTNNPALESITEKSFNGHNYQLYEGRVTWHEAKAFCEQLGGHLLTINSQAEQTFINEWLLDINEHYYTSPSSLEVVWIGATDEVEEGKWKWVTGEPFSYTNWLAGEMNSHEDDIEDYACMEASGSGYWHGQWMDTTDVGGHEFPGVNGNGRVGLICEWGVESSGRESYSAPSVPSVVVHDLTNETSSNSNGASSTNAKVIPYTSGKNVPFSASALEQVKDQQSAVAAINSAVAVMKSAPVAASKIKDNLAVYAEEAVSQAASVTVETGPIYINQSTVGVVESAANSARQAADRALSDGGVEMERDLRTMINFKTSRNDIKIIIEPSAVAMSVDKVRVQTPEYVLTFTKDFIVSSVASSELVIDTALTSVADPNAVALAEAPYQFMASNDAMVGDAMRRLMLADKDGDGRGRTTGVDIGQSRPTKDSYLLGTLPDPKLGSSDNLAMASTKNGALTSYENEVNGQMSTSVNSSDTIYVTDNQKNFQDIQNKDKEMRDAITKLANKGIIEGTDKESKRFSPDNPINRAEIAALISKCLGKLDTSARNSFNDVGTGDWFYSAVSTIKNLNIMSGVSETLFAPSTTIEKQQIVAVVARSLRNRLGYKDAQNTQSELGKFSDSGSIAGWAAKDVALVSKLGMITMSTDAKFKPAASMTRGEAAVILYKLYERVIG